MLEDYADAITSPSSPLSSLLPLLILHFLLWTRIYQPLVSRQYPIPSLRSINCITEHQLIIPSHDLHCGPRVYEALLISHQDRIAKDLHDELLKRSAVSGEELGDPVVRRYLQQPPRRVYQRLDFLAVGAGRVELAC